MKARARQRTEQSNVPELGIGHMDVDVKGPYKITRDPDSYDPALGRAVKDPTLEPGWHRTRVVNVRTEVCDVYIGRDHPAGYRNQGWGNRFHEGKDGTREQVIEKHMQDLRRNPVKMAAVVRELKGKRLGCWCYPLPCHGDNYVKIIEEHEADA